MKKTVSLPFGGTSEQGHNGAARQLRQIKQNQATQQAIASGKVVPLRPRKEGS